MSDQKIEAILDNEREWRRYVVEKVDKLSDDMSLLKVKVATISSFFGILSGAVTHVIIAFIKDR